MRGRTGRDVRVATDRTVIGLPSGGRDRQPRRHAIWRSSRAAWQRQARDRVMLETRSDRRPRACRSRSGACPWSCRAWHRPPRRSPPRTRSCPRSCRPTNASRQTGLSGAQFAPVIATRRPPSASRASADEMWRNAASAMRRSTLATAENGGFISTTLGVMPASR